MLKRVLESCSTQLEYKKLPLFKVYIIAFLSINLLSTLIINIINFTHQFHRMDPELLAICARTEKLLETSKQQLLKQSQQWRNSNKR